MSPRDEAIQRVREVAANSLFSSNPLEVYASELLAAYDEVVAQRDAAQERVDLDVDEFRRILAELADLRVRIVPTPEECRILYDVVQGIVLRAVNAGRQKVPLIVQRDKAEADRDTARAFLSETEAERDRLRKERDAARAENERLAKQRDELVAVARHVVFEGLFRGGEGKGLIQPPFLIPSEKLRQRLVELRDAIAAEQPKPSGDGAEAPAGGRA